MDNQEEVVEDIQVQYREEEQSRQEPRGEEGWRKPVLELLEEQYKLVEQEEHHILDEQASVLANPK